MIFIALAIFWIMLIVGVIALITSQWLYVILSLAGIGLSVRWMWQELHSMPAFEENEGK